MPLLESDFDIKNINKYNKDELINICYKNFKYSDDPISKSELQELTKNQLGKLIVDILKAKKYACKSIKQPNKVVKSKPKSCDDYIMKDLKELCKRKNLSTSGTKAQLCDRLNIKYSECADKKVKFKKSNDIKEYSESESESENENENENESLNEMKSEIKKYLKNKHCEFLENNGKKLLTYTIFTPENYDTCRFQSECDVMIGKRQIIANNVIDIAIKYLYETEKNNMEKKQDKIILNNKTIFSIDFGDDLYVDIYLPETKTSSPVNSSIKNKLSTEQQEILDELNSMTIVKLKSKANKLNINIAGKTKQNIINLLLQYYTDEMEPVELKTNEVEPVESKTNEVEPVESKTEITDEEYKEINNFIKEIIQDNNKQNIILSNENILDLVENKFKTRDIDLNYFIDNKFIYIYENLISYLDIVKTFNKISFNEYINNLNIKNNKEIKFNEFKVNDEGYYIIDDMLINCFNIINLNNETDDNKIIEYYLLFENSITKEFEEILQDDLNVNHVWEFCYLKLHNSEKNNLDILKHIKKDGVNIFYILKELTTIDKKQIAEFLKLNNENKQLCDDLFITFYHYSNNKINEIANTYIRNIRNISSYFKKCIGGKCKLNIEACVDNQQNKRDNIIKQQLSKKIQYRDDKIIKSKTDVIKYEGKDLHEDLIPLGKDKQKLQKLIDVSKQNIHNLNKVVVDTSTMKMPTKLESIAHCLKLI